MSQMPFIHDTNTPSTNQHSTNNTPYICHIIIHICHIIIHICHIIMHICHSTNQHSTSNTPYICHIIIHICHIINVSRIKGICDMNVFVSCINLSLSQYPLHFRHTPSTHSRAQTLHTRTTHILHTSVR